MVSLINKRLHWISDFASVEKNVTNENLFLYEVTYEFQMENRDWLLYLGHQNTTPFDVTGALCDLFDVSINHIKLFPQRDEHLFFSVPGVRDH